MANPSSFFPKKFTFLLLILIALGSGIWLFLNRQESPTDAKFPDRFVLMEEFCQGKLSQVRFLPSQANELLTLANSLEDCTEIELGAGVFNLPNSLSFNQTKGLRVKGKGKNLTTLKFDSKSNGNGLEAESVQSFEVLDLTILDSGKNGLEIRLSQNILIDGVVVRWSNTTGDGMQKNGAYGIYPVNVQNIVLQNSESYFASDAGLYVGQCINALVRYNKAEKNVMGLEIENTINADVYENTLVGNTGGFLAYDLNKNTIVSRNISVHHNRIVGNNFPNFARTGIVKTVPSGVGMVITSTRFVEISENTIGENHTADIGILNGLVSVSSDLSLWPMRNWRTHDIYIHNNQFIGGSGTSVDNGNVGSDRPMGELLSMIQKIRAKLGNGTTMPEILYDGVDSGGTLLLFTTWFGNREGNENGICIETKNEKAPNLLDMNFAALLQNSEEPTEASIEEAIQKKLVKVYSPNSDPPYGGSPERGFSCKGYQFQGFPIALPNVRGRLAI